MNREEWRDPTSAEMRVLARMLSVDFPGCEAYRAQLIRVKVAFDTTTGTTLFLLPDDTSPASTERLDVPLTDGFYDDDDGIQVMAFLMSQGGRLRFLDWMKLDPVSEALQLFPPNDTIAVQVAP